MNDKAKVATVKKALQNMAALAKEDDIVVMFFSGHGVKGGFVCYDGFLYYSDIYSAMGACKSRNKMIFLFHHCHHIEVVNRSLFHRLPAGQKRRQQYP